MSRSASTQTSMSRGGAAAHGRGEPCDCGTVLGPRGGYVTHEAGMDPACTAYALEYAVEYGVKGAHRITTRTFPDLLTAEAFARRWARSNSIGSYWAEITLEGRLVSRYNLA